MHLAQQAQAIVGTRDGVMSTERVDDVARRMGQMGKMGWPEVLARHIPRHWTPRGLRWGWTAVIWLASSVTAGDHRPVSGATSLKGLHHTLRCLTAQGSEPLDVRDDRLNHRRTHVSTPADWHALARDLHECSMEIYDVSQDVIRCEATTVSGDHEVTAEGRVQFGQSKEEPARPQRKVMLGAVAPLGMPLATAVVSGARADEGLYLPIMERSRTGLQPTGRLCVGACTMRAWAPRA